MAPVSRPLPSGEYLRWHACICIHQPLPAALTPIHALCAETDSKIEDWRAHATMPMPSSRSVGMISSCTHGQHDSSHVGQSSQAARSQRPSSVHAKHMLRSALFPHMPMALIQSRQEHTHLHVPGPERPLQLAGADRVHRMCAPNFCRRRL